MARQIFFAAPFHFHRLLFFPVSLVAVFASQRGKGHIARCADAVLFNCFYRDYYIFLSEIKLG
jgi:hypothetical protein